MKAYIAVFLVMFVLAGCNNAGTDPSSKLSAIAEEVRETTAYKIAAIEAGKELAPDDRAVIDTAAALYKAAQYFNTTEKEIGNVAYSHAKAARAAGANVTVKDLLLAGMKAFPPGSPVGMPTLDTFNSFGATYQIHVTKS
jgi:uncharacterized lipoprotein NlpE involved in copper resistance